MTKKLSEILDGATAEELEALLESGLEADAPDAPSLRRMRKRALKQIFRRRRYWYLPVAAACILLLITGCAAAGRRTLVCWLG